MERNRDNLGRKTVLFAANGSSIYTYGKRELSLNLGFPKKFRLTFIIADVSKPILGPKSHQEFLTTLHEHFREIQPKQTSDHSGRLFFVHKDLSDASHAFVSQDMVKRTLRQPYDGPFKVLARKPT
ncbi:hypothetical protein AVEN_85790-1 [Araneus ventricosus]|uniref:Uncharacterized protein n=1 Tax=Araneus ventricosus TaxID=182803 RepID=A0A4Y2S043_ARAVE|nr:hypothetical protein AVEN_202917-1 [Araneus ventricosus]GBN80654.1 hypothetical protein AVEN_85790-1 [Araneus ventricosus]